MQIKFLQKLQLLKFVCLFTFEERREGERRGQGDAVLSTEPDVGAPSRDPEIATRAENKSWRLN